MDLKKLIMLVFLSSSVLANDAEQGDFSNNTQAETITTTTSTVVSQEGTPVPTAVGAAAPVYNQDICVVSNGRGVQTLQIGLSYGSSTRDETCELLKLSRQLEHLGLKVAATSVLCNDPRVFHAMLNAKTPCPIGGLIGDKAIKYYKEHPSIVPDAPVVKRSKSGRSIHSKHITGKYKRH
mgnify:FL=1|tara:strand:- start:1432 stop:1971 length:540 start_codon:yes stop_codon:yes gene_type:complete